MIQQTLTHSAKCHISAQTRTFRKNQKIHIVGSPELKIEGTPVYLDVEGLPDRDFYYLIGARIGNGDTAVQHSLWADTVEDEGKIWREFLAILETVEKPVLIHYGSYEKTFWRRMGERHGKPPEGSKPAKATSSAINLVSLFFAQIYFPTYSNHLKDIASWRGYSWSDSRLFGPNSIACRSEWEASGDPLRKQLLVAYNAEDGKALEILTCFAIGMCQRESPGIAQLTSDIILVDTLKPLKRFNLMSKDGAALPEFKEINNAAYWDYQRQRVYVRSSKAIRKASQRKLKHRARSLTVQGTIEYPVPSSCPRCGGSNLALIGKTTLLTHDVRFMRSGVKGLVKRQIWPRYHCRQCKQLVRPDGTQLFSIRKYGLHLRAYAVNQLVELRISGSKVAKSLNQILHFELTGSLISQFKSDFAKMYGDTVKGLTDRMVTGLLVHADETHARMVGKSGYVWVLSSLEEVVYLYSDSREGDMIWSLLEHFSGVLVSDFYAVYDSIKCPQQKCLIHLMRDINDDLHKYPFDEDLRKIAQAFAELLKPMVETIDKHGLKTRFLAKYVVAVEKYYSWLAQAHFASEAAAGYEKRFSKYRDKLFTFLRHNDVPWNNNNAENAIRAFAELRDIIKGVVTEKGLREYLVLLSICETCKRRGISFLDFLLSGETSIDRFAGKSFPHLRTGFRRGPETIPGVARKPSVRQKPKSVCTIKAPGRRQNNRHDPTVAKKPMACSCEDVETSGAHNPETISVINDQCLVRTQDGLRVVIVSGIVLAEYALGDHVGEAQTMVRLVEQGLAQQNDVARAFGCSARTVRRYQRRFEDGGLAALEDGRSYALVLVRSADSRCQLVQHFKTQGYSDSEIARRIGVSEKAVRNLLRRLGRQVGGCVHAALDSSSRCGYSGPHLSKHQRAPRQADSHHGEPLLTR